MPHPREYHQGPDIQLFVLRVIIEQYFDDSDNGDCYVCDRFEDIRYSVYRHELHNAAERLAWLLAVTPRSAKLTKEIREIWPRYDNEPSKDIKVEALCKAENSRVFQCEWQSWLLASIFPFGTTGFLST